MITTKANIIKEVMDEKYKGLRGTKYYNKVRLVMLNYPEFDFIDFVKSALNWNLEILRKNQYIVTV